MAAKAKAPRVAMRPGSLLWLQGLVCGAIATLATPTFILGGLLLAPAMVSMVTDRSSTKSTARSVILFGLAGTVQALADLWRTGHTIANALDMASDTSTLATAWAAQAGAWLLCELGPLLIALVMDGMSGAKATRLRAARAAYEEQWGLPPSAPEGG
jgi:hypothetical protein